MTSFGRRSAIVAVVGVAALSIVFLESRNASTSEPSPPDPKGLCPPEMQLIDGTFCIDRFEASTADVNPDGSFAPHSPFQSVDGRRVRALAERGVIPQAYISRNQAEAACRESHKRLCTGREWVTACKGPGKKTFPYGNSHKPGYCVDTHRVNPLLYLFQALGPARYQFDVMNDPALNQVPGSVAPTGSFTRCTNEYGVYDMVGNLHEWTADSQGTFRGGFYLDTSLNGPGCDYKTVAHPPTYHDYSTGFRCCRDIANH